VRNRLAAILLVSWFALLGTGAAEFLHNLEHTGQSAYLTTASGMLANEHPSPAAPLPDDSNCDVHAQLHLPLMAAPWTPPLELLAASVPLVPHVVDSLIPYRAPARIDCRGPPAIAAVSHLIGA
jgi:hypothetical protein